MAARAIELCVEGLAWRKAAALVCGGRWVDLGRHFIAIASEHVSYEPVRWVGKRTASGFVDPWRVRPVSPTAISARCDRGE
jgi:hypothetical protein